MLKLKVQPKPFSFQPGCMHIFWGVPANQNNNQSRVGSDWTVCKRRVWDSSVHPGPLIRAVRWASSAPDCLNKARGPALHRQLSGRYQEYQDYQGYQDYQDYQEYQECQEYQRYPESQECQGIFPGTLSRAVLERQQLRIAWTKPGIWTRNRIPIKKRKSINR